MKESLGDIIQRHLDRKVKLRPFGDQGDRKRVGFSGRPYGKRKKAFEGHITQSLEPREGTPTLVRTYRDEDTQLIMAEWKYPDGYVSLQVL